MSFVKTYMHVDGTYPKISVSLPTCLDLMTILNLLKLYYAI